MGKVESSLNSHASRATRRSGERKCEAVHVRRVVHVWSSHDMSTLHCVVRKRLDPWQAALTLVLGTLSKASGRAPRELRARREFWEFSRYRRYWRFRSAPIVNEGCDLPVSSTVELKED